MEEGRCFIRGNQMIIGLPPPFFTLIQNTHWPDFMYDNARVLSTEAVLSN